MFKRLYVETLDYSDCCAMHNYLTKFHLGTHHASSRFAFDDDQFYLEF